MPPPPLCPLLFPLQGPPPVVAPRWDTTSDDVYGSSPGMDALGSAKALQFQHKRLAQLQDKLVNPPMVAPSSLKNQRTSLLPGDVTYQDIQSGMTGFQPAITVDSRSITEMRNSIAAEQNQINQAFYADLFLMLSLTQDHNRTAREVAELQEEKLLMLGPVLERLNDELLDPLVDRTFSIMLRKGLIHLIEFPGSRPTSGIILSRWSSYGNTLRG